MVNREWGGMGQNYLKSLLALGFQAFLILVCVGIYAVLIQTIAATDDISGAIWSCMGYTVLLCFTLFKTGSLAKSVFSAHWQAQMKKYKIITPIPVEIRARSKVQAQQKNTIPL